MDAWLLARMATSSSFSSLISAAIKKSNPHFIPRIPTESFPLCGCYPRFHSSQRRCYPSSYPSIRPSMSSSHGAARAPEPPRAACAGEHQQQAGPPPASAPFSFFFLLPLSSLSLS
ncbi:hypothetical protein VPH35_066016 [Triticum aestivum]